MTYVQSSQIMPEKSDAASALVGASAPIHFTLANFQLPAMKLSPVGRGICPDSSLFIPVGRGICPDPFYLVCRLPFGQAFPDSFYPLRFPASSHEIILYLGISMLSFFNICLFCLTLLLAPATGFAQNTTSDSVETGLKRNLVEAGWLRHWAGVPMQYVGGNEVAGYTNVEKKIIFFKDQRFELNVYLDYDYPQPFNLGKNRTYCRQRKKYEEVSVLTGSWSVKQDSIVLHYRLEKLYNSEAYAAYNYDRNFGRACTLKVLGSCKLNYREVFTFKENNLCSAQSSYECYR